MARRHTPAAVAAAVVLLLATACGAAGTTDAAAPGASTAPGEETRLTVFAAASLRTVFEQIGADFEEAHPGTEVVLSFAGSSTLVSQLAAGAPADVLVTADRQNMTTAADQGLLAATPQVFTTNVPTLVAGADNPLGLTSLADAAQSEVDLVLCAEQVPCGVAAHEVADAAGVSLSPVSEETSVTAVLGKVTAGQAHAGIVYLTDAAGAGEDVTQIDLPRAEEARTEYPAVVTAAAEEPELGEQFVAHLSSDGAQQHLADAGFGGP